MADDPNPPDTVVVGASAGGVEALVRLVRSLPVDLPAAVFVVLHVPPSGTSFLPQILSRQHGLPAYHALDDEPIKPGTIYVAPPDHHLIIDGGQVRLTKGARENGMRPAVDALFRSAAEERGSRVIGVVLSGTLNDGTAGLAAVKRAGGVAIVQSPDDALYPSMPLSALDHVDTDYVATPQDMGPLIAKLVTSGTSEGNETVQEEDAVRDTSPLDIETHPKPPNGATGLSCPDCGGALWEMQDGELIRYECRVGHGYSEESLDSRQAEALDVALWAALRSLEERAALAERMAERSRVRGQEGATRRFTEMAADASDRAAVIRHVLERGTPTPS